MEEEQVEQQPQHLQMLPPGYRFNPSEEELVGYLFNHISGFSLQNIPFCPVVVCDLYSSAEPWEIWPRCQSERFGLPIGDVYVITKLNKSKTSSTRFDRSVGISGGTWHQTSKVKKIEEVDCGAHKLCGLCKGFNYKNLTSPENGCWLLTEYTISIDGGKTYSEEAICKLNHHKTSEGADPQPPTTGKRKFDAAAGCSSQPSSKVPRICDGAPTLSPDLISLSASNHGVGSSSSSSMTNIHNTLPTNQSHNSVNEVGFNLDDNIWALLEEEIEPDSTGQQVQSLVEPNQDLISFSSASNDGVGSSSFMPNIHNTLVLLTNQSHNSESEVGFYLDDDVLALLEEEIEHGSTGQQVQSLVEPNQDLISFSSDSSLNSKVPIIDDDFINRLSSPSYIPCSFDSDLVHESDMLFASQNLSGSPFSYLQDLPIPDFIAEFD